MPRRLRHATGGLLYHVLNRAVGRNTIFNSDADYQAFERVIERTYKLLPIRILSYCLMPNHFHMVLWPKRDTDLSNFMRLLTVTHTQRYHAHRRTAGTGPLYQGRFKSFPIQKDEHLLTVCRYIERNPLKAKFVRSAENWPWSSLSKRTSQSSVPWLLPQTDWPVEPIRNWPAFVNRPQTHKEIESIQLSIKRGRPYGDPPWQKKIARQLQLESTFRPQGRQRIHPINDSRPR